MQLNIRSFINKEGRDWRVRRTIKIANSPETLSFQKTSNVWCCRSRTKHSHIDTRNTNNELTWKCDVIWTVKRLQLQWHPGQIENHLEQKWKWKKREGTWICHSTCTSHETSQVPRTSELNQQAHRKNRTLIITAKTVETINVIRTDYTVTNPPTSCVRKIKDINSKSYHAETDDPEVVSSNSTVDNFWRNLFSSDRNASDCLVVKNPNTNYKKWTQKAKIIFWSFFWGRMWCLKIGIFFIEQ